MDFSMQGISKFERQRLEREREQLESAAHAFADDYREWGWFDPEQWYDAVKEMKEAGFA